jgi:4-hydroxy-tetrahydrodipicolinate synthase
MSVGTLPGGVYPYLVSPLHADGTVDTGALGVLVEDLVAAGVDVAGVSAFATTDAVEQAQRFVELGVDGLVVMRQHAFAVSPAAASRYFADVAASVDVPIVLYTNPALLGSDLTPDAIASLAAHDNIRYVKDASGNTGRIVSILERVGDSMGVFSASAHVPLLVYQLGGIGWMAGPACAVPHAALALHRWHVAGDAARAMALQRAMWPLNEAFTAYPLGACIKAALTLRGYDVGDPVPPQEPLGADGVARLRAALDRIDAALAALQEGTMP